MKTKAGCDPEGAEKQIEAQEATHRIPLADVQPMSDESLEALRKMLSSFVADLGGLNQGSILHETASLLARMDAEGTVPAGPQADLATWQKKAGEFLREPEYYQNTATMAMVLRAHLAAMPQAQPDAGLLKALLKRHGRKPIGHKDCDACDAIAQAETGAAG